MDGQPPRITISLVTYNGLRWLPGCVESVRRQDMADFELLVFDNASRDGSVGWLREVARAEPRMRLTDSAVNLGFAAAHNRQIDAASAEFVLLLNQDVELDAGFLRHALAAFDARPRVAAIQPRLRRLDADGKRTDVLDSTGLVMQRDRRVTSRRQGEREANADRQVGPVWGADGPAPVYRRRALLSARLPRSGGGWEVLDEDFFMYKEDVDLAWRLRLLGWEARYEPAALAWHARGAGGRPAHTLLDIARANFTIPRWVKALSWRNQRLTQVKNERSADFIRDLPRILRREVLSLSFILVADPVRLSAIGALVAGLPAAAAKRRHLIRRGVDVQHHSPSE